MNNKNAIETIIGAFVLLIAAGFAVFAYQSSNMKPVEGYALKARFSSVDGIGMGSEVRIGGIKVGVVSDLDIDPKTYEALLTIQMREAIKIPEDSNAGVVSSGLLGNKFVEITPGGAEEMLAENGEISFTQSSVNLESLIGKMVHSGGGVEEKDAETTVSPEDSKAENVGLPALE
jgi:phospholipid/cholesterol/gamma-HCH transport system substrate-binding protein